MSGIRLIHFVHMSLHAIAYLRLLIFSPFRVFYDFVAVELRAPLQVEPGVMQLNL